MEIRCLEVHVCMYVYRYVCMYVHIRADVGNDAPHPQHMYNTC